MKNNATVLYYSCNKIPDLLTQKVKDQIKYASNGLPIISITQKPINDMGTNICVGDIGQSLQNVYRQALEGAKLAKTEYVVCCEDDTLYVPGQFTYVPTRAPFAYNLNRWNLHADRENHVYSYRRRPVFGMCVALKDALIECLENRFNVNEPVKENCWGEPGLYESHFGLQEYEYTCFETIEPCVVIAHKDNTTGHKLLGKDAEPVADLAPWGNGVDLLKRIYFNGYNFENKRPVKIPNLKRSKYNHIKSKVFKVDYIYNNKEQFFDTRKPDSQKRFHEVFPPFIKDVQEASVFNQVFSDEALEKYPYYDYLISKLNPADRDPLTKKGKRHVLSKMRDAISLYNDIQEHGLKAPLDMFKKDGKLVLHRGGRRLVILKTLGFKRVPCRIFESRKIFGKLSPDKTWNPGKYNNGSIHNIAINQFLKHKENATDKYWVHGYTKKYDKEFAEYLGKPVNLLEIGVKRGASLLLWKDVFPEGKIYGLDRDKITRPIADLSKFKIFTGNQQDRKFLNKQVIPEGPYDIIIDDGSHIPEHQLTTFNTLWPSIADGGTYVIEDLHWNYLSDSDERMINKCKELVDSIYKDPTVASVNFYYNICFIRKI